MMSHRATRVGGLPWRAVCPCLLRRVALHRTGRELDRSRLACYHLRQSARASEPAALPVRCDGRFFGWGYGGMPRLTRVATPRAVERVE